MFQVPSVPMNVTCWEGIFQAHIRNFMINSYIFSLKFSSVEVTYLVLYPIHKWVGENGQPNRFYCVLTILSPLRPFVGVAMVGIWLHVLRITISETFLSIFPQAISRRARKMKRRNDLDLLHIFVQLVIQPQRRIIPHFDLLWLYEHTRIIGACKVSLPTDTSIILTCWLIKFNSHPERSLLGSRVFDFVCVRGWDGGNGTDVADCTPAVG